jgi:hypothetical protein
MNDKEWRNQALPRARYEGCKPNSKSGTKNQVRVKIRQYCGFLEHYTMN